MYDIVTFMHVYMVNKICVWHFSKAMEAKPQGIERWIALRSLTSQTLRAIPGTEHKVEGKWEVKIICMGHTLQTKMHKKKTVKD